MNTILNLAAAGAFVWGAFQFLSTVIALPRYDLWGASAVQVTQVYTEATYHVASAAALFLLAILLELVVCIRKVGEAQDSGEILRGIEKTNELLHRIEAALTSREH